ncbi:hypothetical protein DFH06DRAFT_1260106 [Mycena polygramma]|nr:hypothetical protein DFH06DRAFT_1260106 [Mycena polygramma]
MAARSENQAETFVYYRVYLPSGLIASKTAFTPGDPFTGRIRASSVPAPHTVATLKRCIAHAENFADPHLRPSRIYETLTSGVELKESADIFLLPHNQYPRPATLPGTTDQRLQMQMARLNRHAPRSTPETPYAFVFEGDMSVQETTERDFMARNVAGVAQDFLYYHLYTRTGEDTSSTSFDADRPGVGRVLKAAVVPPWSATSIKRCIAKAEKRPIYSFADMYYNIATRQAFGDSDLLPEGVGDTLEWPLVIVQPERRPGLYNRPLKILRTNSQLSDLWYEDTRGRRPSFVSYGDVVYTDGIPRVQDFHTKTGEIRREIAYAIRKEPGGLDPNDWVPAGT